MSEASHQDKYPTPSITGHSRVAHTPAEGHNRQRQSSSKASSASPAPQSRSSSLRAGHAEETHHSEFGDQLSVTRLSLLSERETLSSTTRSSLDSSHRNPEHTTSNHVYTIAESSDSMIIVFFLDSRSAILAAPRGNRLVVGLENNHLCIVMAEPYDEDDITSGRLVSYTASTHSYYTQQLQENSDRAKILREELFCDLWAFTSPEGMKLSVKRPQSLDPYVHDQSTSRWARALNSKLLTYDCFVLSSENYEEVGDGHKDAGQGRAHTDSNSARTHRTRNDHSSTKSKRD